MKKSELKNIIRESIKKLMNNKQKRFQEQGTPDMFHRWNYLQSNTGVPGCNNLPPNFAAGSIAVYSNSVPGGAYTAGAFNTPAGAAAQTAVWNALGAPSVGQVVKIDWSGYGAQGELCMVYEGASPTQTVPNGSFQSTNYLGTFPDCETCYGEQPPSDMIKCACCDKFGMPVSMQQMVPATQGCNGAENTVYAGLNVSNCAVSQASGGPGPKCKGTKPGPSPTDPILNPSPLVTKPEDELVKSRDNTMSRMQELANIKK